MKKITLIFAVAAILLSCTGKKGNRFTITGVVKGAEASMVYLQKMDSTGLVTIDSAAMKNNEFAKVVSSKDKVISDANHTFSNVVKNLNILLGFMGVNGVKTGYTEEAGQVLVTAKPVETIRFSKGFQIIACDFLFGRTQDQIISPCLTIRRARLGASLNS